MDVRLTNPKNQKHLKESDLTNNKDRISELPDSILCHILSFLSTKNAVRTSILATRWKTLWPSVLNLDFDHTEFSDDHMLMNFVDNVLLRQGISYIQKFRVICGERCDTTRVKTWIPAAVTCNISRLTIVCLIHFVELPKILYTCEKLVVLKLREVVLKVPQLICLPSVKIVHLKYVYMGDDEAVKQLISSCPVLEDISITRSIADNLQNLCVCSHSLKKLCIKFVDDPEVEEYKVMVDAPNLECLYVVDCSSQSIIINKSSSLVKAYINVAFTDITWHDEHSSKLSNLLNVISNVRHRNFHCPTLETFDDYSFHNNALPMFCNLTHLELHFHDAGWKLLPALLENSPKLKDLLVFNKRIPTSYRLRLPSVPQCLLTSLECIEIKIFCWGEEEMDLVRYFLENSKFLKKMTIRRRYDAKKDEPISILKDIFMFQRGSSICQVAIL